MIKTLKISEKLHTKLKTYCSQHKLKLNEWAEQLFEINLKHDVLIEYLSSFADIEYMKDKLKSAMLRQVDQIEITTLKRQLQLLSDSRVIFAEAFLSRIKAENDNITNIK